MNGMAEIVCAIEGKKLPVKHIPGPEGVRGRNSDNELILEKLGWQVGGRGSFVYVYLSFGGLMRQRAHPGQAGLAGGRFFLKSFGVFLRARCPGLRGKSMPGVATENPPTATKTAPNRNSPPSALRTACG